MDGVWLWGERLFFDPGQVLYPYKSPAGHRLIVLHFGAFSWLCKAIAITVTIVLEYCYFYLPFLGTYVLW